MLLLHTSMAILAGFGWDFALGIVGIDHPIHPAFDLRLMIRSSHRWRLRGRLLTARLMQFDYLRPTLLMDVDTSLH